ncbi:hypothetical protein L1987_58072 [Smallanthus sonchifolius]|uniref:Uncharacterized protein n=1 Tax=Smallanthus sonchifolius TaxID=185202 RepID=A0ACB9DEQ8_9ASTR|nr:hypothetical protein L1987_58072 [Smallanthus sonchifolius]
MVPAKLSPEEKGVTTMVEGRGSQIVTKLPTLQRLGLRRKHQTQENQTLSYVVSKLFDDKSGGNYLIEELCNGCQLLINANKGVIVFDSLKNSCLLGLGDLSDDDLRCAVVLSAAEGGKTKVVVVTGHRGGGR